IAHPHGCTVTFATMPNIGLHAAGATLWEGHSSPPSTTRTHAPFHLSDLKLNRTRACRRHSSAQSERQVAVEELHLDLGPRLALVPRLGKDDQAVCVDDRRQHTGPLCASRTGDVAIRPRLDDASD